MIESVLKEKRVFYPNPELSKEARIKSMDEYEKLVEWAKNDFEGFWDHFAKEKIDWIKPYKKVLDDSKAPHYKWFVDGKLNITQHCIDRHLPQKKDKVAILFEDEMGNVEEITYGELYERVNQFANLLKAYGVKKGDRVVLYMSMIPELAIAMLACARIGAIHSVVFAGFSANALRDRIEDANAKLVITCDGGYRKGKVHNIKSVVDEALKEPLDSVEKVLIYDRGIQKFELIDNRDVVINSELKEMEKECEPVILDSEDIAFILYTSGSTGKPKGVQHAVGGYLLWAILTMEWVFDIKDDDMFWCTADIGWITGHTYIVYGPLAVGTTSIMYEGVPVYPDAGRWWKMVEKYKVTKFYTAPTAIRILKKVAPDEPKKYDLSSLRILGTVGEPIDPESWLWYYENVGNKKCSIVDTWWQTETGGHMISPLPGATPMKPGSATKPLPGIFAEVFLEDGSKAGVNEGGFLCITKPWPSMIRDVWGNPQRYKKTYFSFKGNIYLTGDDARVDEDGYIWIMGRADDVINVSGHRLGTMEIESAINKHPNVAESAVVGKHHEIKGEGIFAFIVPREWPENLEEFKNSINEVVTNEIGPIAKPDWIVLTEALPKTRSGKIMRRILRAIAAGEEIKQDISTLENPEIVEKLKEAKPI
ncbi:acetate--CoA ligase [Nitrosophilus kaiyonis]|uniref:acetate--CoA ligase n=1 Tax=Nitrosophilus kaiyonis TaxID=2930200 RepID=UPI002491E7A9|nr:acetate--CoA ligase [Nitrosophilus kaiyonis]